ncbi:hypothetical protein B0T19DRAFT_145882 [Cercophora scortea]|uniref:RlpA-like protein double-psi beta-barrel domain-containing protein n=1 Tax=Cercophora scortea TaxID=314031 RepID=A0AAE0IZW4_9PEZI|nr:hypothetical protein B0T19DRAFT_145882 [Cercophora scortea]
MKAAVISFTILLAGSLAAPVALLSSSNVSANNTTITTTTVPSEKRAADGMHRGDMTYYEVGLGSCGQDDSGKGDTENIVAVSASLGNPCGQSVIITASNGNQVSAVVRDKCPSCGEGELDVSEKVFMDLVGDLGVGKTEVTWKFS